jgi:hypothetical protein
MGFSLRGGRPKNMGQGIYWVQRHRDDLRRRQSANDRALDFNNRYNRILQGFSDVFLAYIGPKGTIEVTANSKLHKSLSRYNEINSLIEADIDSATQGDLSKLATAAKNTLIEIAKRENWHWEWDASIKSLVLNKAKLDFS